MSRRHRADKREINPDPKFGDLIVSKFMNNLMHDGKKSVAEAHRLWRLRQDPGQGQAGPGRRSSIRRSTM